MGKLLAQSIQSSHLAFTTLGLQMHVPLTLHAKPFVESPIDPYGLQSQSLNMKTKIQVFSCTIYSTEITAIKAVVFLYSHGKNVIEVYITS